MSDPRADHLDLDALADHLAGERDATPHLSTCGGCTARLAELEAAEQRVVAALATLSAPPLPAAVTDRIAAAVAAEPPPTAANAPAAGRTGAAGRPGAAGLPDSAATGSVLHLSRRRSAARRRTWLPAAAAGVVLFAGGMIGYSLVSGPGSSDDATSASDAAGATATTEVAPASGVPTLSSGLDYADAAAVATTLPRALAGGDSDTAAMQSEDAAEALDPLRDPAALEGCLTALLPPEQPDLQPVALDYASYDGAPALAVVLPDEDPDRLGVYVVGPGCSQADDGLLFFTRVDRP